MTYAEKELQKAIKFYVYTLAIGYNTTKPNKHSCCRCQV